MSKIGEWQTVRLYVGGAKKDTKNERKMLEEDVLPQLRTFCEARRLHLTVSDQEPWVLSEDQTGAELCSNALAELDLCRSAQTTPLMVWLGGEKYGMSPSFLPDELTQKYGWTHGSLSLPAMELLEGVLREPEGNPNAFVAFRDTVFMHNPMM